MKKSFMFALAGLAMFAFTQCGPSGSQEFKDCSKIIDDVESSIKKASNCDELQAATIEMLTKVAAMGNNYSEDQKMTKEEEAELNKRLENLDKFFSEKQNELN
ncbi:MAG: hypothetical protein IKX51_07495 [Bacteroidales bacterium]|nr:hypothetical protein [Bacteroidales bacterium]